MNNLQEQEQPKENFQIREIKSTTEIIIGDILVYTGKPRGTGMFLPDIGEKWEMKTKDDLINASIQIIERGRGWRPLLKPLNQ